MSVLPYALAAARRGWRVFPARLADKRPIRAFTDWEHRATTDPARIRAMFAHERCNVGIACGPSGLVVLDLDMPKPSAAVERDTSARARHDASRPSATDATAKRPGADALAALCASHGQPYPAAAFAVRTPSGGTHLYFTAPPGVELRNTKGGTPRGLGPLIDTRAHGGYVIGPGSRTAAGTYQVINRARPAPLPGWLTGLLTRIPPPVECIAPAAVAVGDLGAYAAAALHSEVQRVLHSPDRGHNFALNKAAYNLGRLIGAGIIPHRELVETELQTAGETAHTSLDDTPDRIRAVIRAGIDAGIRNPKRTAA